MLKILENLYQKTQVENIFLFQQNGDLNNKLLKIQKDNNIYNLVCFNIYLNTFDVVKTFSPLPFLNSNPELSKNELDRRILSTLFDMVLIELKTVKSNFLGDAYEINKYPDYLKEAISNKRKSKGKDIQFHSFSDILLTNANIIFQNNQIALNIVYSKNPKLGCKMFSSDEKNVEFNEVKDFSNNFIGKNFNEVISLIQQKKYILTHHLFLHLNFDYTISNCHDFSIKDLLFYYPIDEKYKKINITSIFNEAELNKIVADSLLFGGHHHYEYNTITIFDYLMKDDFLYALSHDLLNISSLANYLNFKEYFLYDKLILQPKLLIESQKREIKLLSTRQYISQYNSDKNTILNDKILTQITKIKKAQDKVQKKYSKNNVTNIFNQEYLSREVIETGKLNLCIVNKINNVNSNYSIILEQSLVKIKLLNSYSIVNNSKYCSISFETLKRHKGSGNGLSSETTSFLIIKLDGLSDLIMNKFKILPSNLENELSLIIYKEDEKVKILDSMLDYNDIKTEITYNISSVFKEIMTTDLMLNFKSKHMHSFNDFKE